MIVLIAAILSVYLLFLIVLIIGWNKSNKIYLPSRTDLPRVTVLIPVRNEEQHLPGLFEKLNQQNATSNSFEVIFINDHSTDKSKEAYLQQQSTLQFDHHWIDLPDALQGKKAALTLGIEKAKFDIILTTDADAKPASAWIKRYQEVFAEEKVQMAFGKVEVVSNGTFFSDMQQMEFASLMSTAAATLYWRIPTMCNGANLGFRKKAFEKVGGYAAHIHLASGDDEFLYHSIHRLYPGSIRFIADHASVVTVKSKPSIKELLSQRTRWASKWKRHNFFPMQALALFIAMVQLSWLALPFVFLKPNVLPSFYLALIAVKVVLEAILLKSVIKQSNFKLAPFLALQLLYAPYVIFSGLSATFNRFHWKGRDYSN
jgi:poly-beta-1,6-N-acetyl-D-glucosamine synthase